MTLLIAMVTAVLCGARPVDSAVVASASLPDLTVLHSRLTILSGKAGARRRRDITLPFEPWNDLKDLSPDGRTMVASSIGPADGGGCETWLIDRSGAKRYLPLPPGSVTSWTTVWSPSGEAFVLTYTTFVDSKPPSRSFVNPPSSVFVKANGKWKMVGTLDAREFGWNGDRDLVAIFGPELFSRLRFSDVRALTYRVNPDGIRQVATKKGLLGRCAKILLNVSHKKRDGFLSIQDFDGFQSGFRWKV